MRPISEWTLTPSGRIYTALLKQPAGTRKLPVHTSDRALSDHVSDVTGNYSGHMTRMPAPRLMAFREADSGKGLK